MEYRQPGEDTIPAQRQAQFLEEQENGGSSLRLRGEWTVLNAALIEKQISGRKSGSAAALDVQSVEKLDMAGALLIRKYFPEARLDLSETQKKLFEMLPGTLKAAEEKKARGIKTFFTNFGRSTLETFSFLYRIFAFTGQVFISLAGCITHPARFRFAAIVRHIDETGIRAVPIIGLLGLLMSMVVSYQAAIQLQKFGASIFTIDLTVISLLREMAVLITAIMVAGRSGSAFAAEIGVMKLREEVDALKTMGIDPMEALVVPRIVALLITLPLLTFFAMMTGLAGGALMASGLLDIPLGQYIDRVDFVATPSMFFVGMIKAPVFALLISIVCSYQGMNVTGSAESVGRLTTVAVVQSIFIVLLMDALFSIFFANLGI